MRGRFGPVDGQLCASGIFAWADNRTQDGGFYRVRYAGKPFHAQHRGRQFLPFADDDPRTVEVMSEALLLARVGEIQDPTILAQIRMTT